MKLDFADLSSAVDGWRGQRATIQTLLVANYFGSKTTTGEGAAFYGGGGLG